MEDKVGNAPPRKGGKRRLERKKERKEEEGWPGEWKREAWKEERWQPEEGEKKKKKKMEGGMIPHWAKKRRKNVSMTSQPKI
jgi:hypothetical protein